VWQNVGIYKPPALSPVVQACRKSYTAVLKSLQALDLITLLCCASVLSVSIVISRSASSSPKEPIVLCSSISDGGVGMEDLIFLFGPPF